MQALGILKFLAEASQEGDVYGEVLKAQLQGFSKIRPAAINNHLFHDRLSEMNRPFYFSEFMGMAQKFGFRFLAEADYSEMQDFFLKPEIAGMLQKVAGNNIIRKEQYLDFIKGRKFRKTLLCHESIPLKRQINPADMKILFFPGNSAVWMPKRTRCRRGGHHRADPDGRPAFPGKTGIRRAFIGPAAAEADSASSVADLAAPYEI